MLRRPQHKSDYNKKLSHRLNNHYYSLDIGPAHIVVFSTEFYFFFDPKKFGYKQIKYQYEWLKADLEKANRKENRAKRPFIFVFGHRPMYCLKKSECETDEPERSELRKGLKEWPPKKHHHHHHHSSLYSNETIGDDHSSLKQGPENEFPDLENLEKSDLYYGLEKLFYNSGVDMFIAGHEHYYFRTKPIYGFSTKSRDKEKKNDYKDPSAPIHIVSGSAGCWEKHNKFIMDPWWLVKHSSDYGYMKMKFLSSHKVELKQYSVDQVRL